MKTNFIFSIKVTITSAPFLTSLSTDHWFVTSTWLCMIFLYFMRQSLSSILPHMSISLCPTTVIIMVIKYVLIAGRESLFYHSFLVPQEISWLFWHLAGTHEFYKISCVKLHKRLLGEFPSGPVDKNLPANAGDMGSIPGPGRFHMPQSN